MPNITIGNNGHESLPEVPADPDNGIEWQPAQEASPTIKVTDQQTGTVTLIKPNTSTGLSLPVGVYTVEVI